MSNFTGLMAAAIVWFALHAGVAGSPLRFWLVERVGDKAYRGAFSFASLVSLLWLIYEYRGAPFVPLFITPSALSFVPLLLMPFAFVFLVGAFTAPSPTSVGGEKLLSSASPARGMLRVTRHPFLWAAFLWALAHAAANCDIGSLLFFGSLGLTALRGTFDIDRKRRRTNPREFARFEHETSNLPFAAVLTGRNQLVGRELWLPLLAGVALALGTIALHSRFFGASAVPQLHGF